MSSSNTASTQLTSSNEQLAQLCKASADGLRLDILRVLSGDSFSVQELCQILGLKQSALSHHLKLLASAELVITRREGNTLFYRRGLFSHGHLFCDWQASLFASIDRCPLNSSHRSGITQVEAARTASSKAFFLENAAKFREQQDLIASFEQYADSVATFIAGLELPVENQYAKAIEIGPGDGRFLSFLSPLFAHISAYDNSSAMIAAAETAVILENLDNITLVLGDSALASQQQSNADCVVINMVLHHIASPADIFIHSAELLKPGGALVITDLCLHDQTWAQEACGDIWLGFEPDDLTHWAKSAGLEEGQSSFLAQRNGFRIQIRHFYKPHSQTLSQPSQKGT
ncbi:MAG: metalloregulator ArsR/SmtB family transcription factor [Pseudomonadales bacterium]|nr:metalloregulator ArsR/SmtB family transcription factor [Pseudomonadales bacterium]